MARCSSPVNKPKYNYPMNNYDKYGDAAYYNSSGNHCHFEGANQYPFTAQDHEALRQTGRKNAVVPRTLDGKPVYKPYYERAYSCDCNLDSHGTSKFTNDTLKHEVKRSKLKRGCDCHKRNGLQDECPRAGHVDRWQKIKHGSQQPCYHQGQWQGMSTTYHETHPHHRPTSPLMHRPCQYATGASGVRRTSSNPKLGRSPTRGAQSYYL